MSYMSARASYMSCIERAHLQQHRPPSTPETEVTASTPLHPTPPHPLHPSILPSFPPCPLHSPTPTDQDLFSFLGPAQRPPWRWVVAGPARCGASWHVDPKASSAWNALCCGRVGVGEWGQQGRVDGGVCGGAEGMAG